MLATEEKAGEKSRLRHGGTVLLSTEVWAKSFGISVDATPPEVEDFSKLYARSTHETAVRVLILQGVIAVASGVDPGPIVNWFRSQRIWPDVTAGERAFLELPSPAARQCSKMRWHEEAQWALLWSVGMVEALGLPTAPCNSQLVCDEIIPPLGSDVAEFLKAARLRPAGALLAEDDRTYDLWCRALYTRRNGDPLPEDLNWEVLYERRYAFEWLDGMQEWDDVTCDA